MVSPTEDLQTGISSTPDQLDNENLSEDTSTSQTPEKELSTFDVIMDAIKPKSEKDGEDDIESDTDNPDGKTDDEAKAKDSGNEEGESDEPSVEELKTWKPKTRQRFEQLQTKYREVSGRLEKAESEAGQYRNFIDYLDTNGVTQDEANELFHVGALMKNDPFKALEIITPYYENLLHITGNILPNDLVQQVNAGYITQAHAVELSLARAQNQIIPVVQQQAQQRVEIRQQGQNTADMQSAVADWERKWSTSDPDYNVKKTRVLERIEVTLARASRNNQLPKNVNEAIAIADQARKEVEAEFRQTKTRKPISTVDGNGGNSNLLPEPKNTLDVIKRTLNQ